MSDKKNLRRITIQQVAKQAGTSPSTVSRVLNSSAPVREDLRLAVLQAVAALGYRPNLLARGLKTRASHSLGLVINDILNPFYSAVASGVEAAASVSGYAVMLCNSNEDPRRELEILSMLRDKAVDGIILTPTGENQAAIEELMAYDIAVVQIDRKLADLRASAVVVENESAAYAATQHLLGQGHTRIGFATYNFERMTLAERERGYRRALQEAGLQAGEESICRVSLFLDHLPARLTALLCSPSAPTAILAGNNRIALGVLSSIRDLGRRIPDDIALAVFDDLELFALSAPPVTAVSQPAFEMGSKAVELLLNQLSTAEPLPTQTVVYHPELIIRESSGPHRR